MKIYLDTNIIFDDWLLDSNQAKILERYLSWTNDELCIPEVVLKELSRQYLRKYEKAQLDHRDLSKIISIIGDSVKPLRNKSEAEGTYKEVLTKRLLELKARIIEVPEISIDSLLERDLEEKKPFHPSGKGFRDALIWESILSDCHNHDEEVVLISEDNVFGDQKPKDISNLHQDLVLDLISNGYSKDRVTLVKNLRDFNEKYTIELLEKVYKLGEEIEGSLIENINVIKILDRYKKYIIWEIEKELPQLLSISMGLYEKVTLLDWPNDPLIIEAYDLKDNLIQAIIITSALIDAKIYTDEKGFEKLIGYTGENNKIYFILENKWDPILRKYEATIRFRLHAAIGILWDKKNNEGEGAQIIKFSFQEEDLLEK